MDTILEAQIFVRLKLHKLLKFGDYLLYAYLFSSKICDGFWQEYTTASYSAQNDTPVIREAIRV